MIVLLLSLKRLYKLNLRVGLEKSIIYLNNFQEIVTPASSAYSSPGLPTFVPEQKNLIKVTFLFSFADCTCNEKRLY
jgi:hypothetical protein